MLDYLPDVRHGGAVEPRRVRATRRHAEVEVTEHRVEAARDLDLIRIDQFVIAGAYQGAFEEEADAWRRMRFLADEDPFLLGKAMRHAVNHERANERTIERRLMCR